ncbi:MAG: hypothetical protein K5882_01365 [Bacteroidales bacterium]|nr:hypothetical protein [Bacteroidales bacterium]
MKKLETLNSPKYSLTPEKMGKLVGGERVATQTSGGTNSQGKAYSCDTRYVLTGEDRYTVDLNGTTATVVAETSFHFEDSVEKCKCACNW